MSGDDFQLILLAIGVPLAILLFIAWLGRTVLGPIDAASRARRYPTRYHIIDFFCLIVELQIVLAVVSLGGSMDVLIWVGAFSALMVLVVWSKGVSVLSGAGIQDPRRRATFNWFVLPFTYTAALLAIPIIVGVTATVIEGRARRIPWYVWLVAIVIPFALVLAHRAVRWIVAEASQPQDERRKDASDRHEIPADEIAI